MLVREIMTAPAVSVRPDAELEEALQIMAERRISALPIVDEAGLVIGALSEVDLVKHILEPDRRAHDIPPPEDRLLAATVGEIMHAPITTSEGVDVVDLMGALAGESHQTLPVVREGRLVGVVSPGDVLRALWRSDDDLFGDVVSAFHGYTQDQWSIAVRRGVVELVPLAEGLDVDLALTIAHEVLGVRRVHVRAQGGSDS
ncbi:MAG: CBS domain-containing protein [Dermatophilaceae bacterium]